MIDSYYAPYETYCQAENGSQFFSLWPAEGGASGETGHTAGEYRMDPDFLFAF